MVNGYTGAMAGEHPLSWVKITLAVLAVLIVISHHSIALNLSV